jgi:hypothetical protein
MGKNINNNTAEEILIYTNGLVDIFDDELFILQESKNVSFEFANGFEMAVEFLKVQRDSLRM